MAMLSFVGKEEPNIQRFQRRVIERQRTFNIAYSQDDVVDHVLSFRV
jgi:hypothetical protein